MHEYIVQGDDQTVKLLSYSEIIIYLNSVVHVFKHTLKHKKKIIHYDIGPVQPELYVRPSPEVQFSPVYHISVVFNCYRML